MIWQCQSESIRGESVRHYGTNDPLTSNWPTGKRSSEMWLRQPLQAKSKVQFSCCFRLLWFGDACLGCDTHHVNYPAASNIHGRWLHVGVRKIVLLTHLAIDLASWSLKCWVWFAPTQTNSKYEAHTFSKIPNAHNCFKLRGFSGDSLVLQCLLDPFSFWIEVAQLWSQTTMSKHTSKHTVSSSVARFQSFRSQVCCHRLFEIGNSSRVYNSFEA